MLSLIILNSLVTDSLHFPSVFINGLIQLFFNVMDRIKIINQMWLGLMFHLEIKQRTPHAEKADVFTTLEPKI